MQRESRELLYDPMRVFGKEDFSLRNKSKQPQSVVEPHVAYATCPHCDGENVLENARSSRGELILADCEIPCRHCQSIFALSSSKLRIESLEQTKLDAA